METQPSPTLVFEVDAAAQVARWRPLVHWLPLVPHYFVVAMIGFVAMFVSLIVWFAVLFTKQSPPGLSGFLAMYLRYAERINSYYFCMHEEYPPFDFQTSMQDPGDYPTRISFRTDDEMNRWLVFVKWLLVFPHMIVLMFLSIAVWFVQFIAFFAVLFTGRWPEGMLRFFNGVRRWWLRVAWYAYLQTDAYPPFSMD